MECCSLTDRLKTLQDTHQHDLSELEDRVAELQMQLEEMCSEREELSERLSSTKELLTSMEAELQRSTDALTAANSEVVCHRSKISQLQALVEASERTRQEREKETRTQAASAQVAQSTVTSLNSKISETFREPY